MIKLMLKKRFDVVSRSFNSGKKAQITIFIILGILILLALVLVIFLKKEAVIFKPETLTLTEKGKVEKYLTSCLDQIGTKALFLTGLQAGYIEVPKDISQDGNLHLKLSPENVVPYWAYGKTLMIPSLPEIKSRVDQYVEENFRPCLFAQAAFNDTYNLIEKSSLKADTQFTDQKTIFKVHWDIDVKDKAGETITQITDHLYESPTKFKRVYEAANTITTREMADLKLEDLTQDLISLEHENLPVAGMEVTCNKKVWKVSEVKSTLQDMLRVNLKELKVKGSDFIAFPDTLPYLQNHYVWDVGPVSKEVSVTFNYDNNYPFLFYVTPQKSGLMESGMQGGSSTLSFFCLQMWKFTYDVVYPVLVRVRDETTGYNFQTAFTVHLVRNTPNRQTPEIRSPANFIKTVTDQDYCKNRDYPMSVLTYELVENNQTGVYSREPLSQVNVSFTCLKYRCEIGQTEYGFNNKGNVAGFQANFPYCVGGILRGEKPNYKEDWQRVVSKAGVETELNLIPLFNFPVSGFKVMKYTPIGEVEGRPLFSGPKELSSETAMIKLTNKKNGKVFQEFTQAISPQLDKKITEQTSVDFLAKADFNYGIEIYLFNGENMVGGYKGNWTIPWEELKNSKEIIFPVLSKDKIDDENELFNFISSLEKQSSYLPQPEIKQK